MTEREPIQWQVVKEAGEPIYHLRLIYPWAQVWGVPAANVTVTLDVDELRSLQDAIAGALYDA